MQRNNSGSTIRHRHRCEASCNEGATFTVDGRHLCDTHAAFAMGEKAATERIVAMIEERDGPREGRSLDFGDVITSNAFDDWIDDLLAAIRGGDDAR